MVKAGNIIYSKASDFPETVPIFPLTGALLLPGGHMPLNIFEPRYLEMIDDAMSSSKIIGMIQPCLKSDCSGDTQPTLSKIGCLGRISAFQETGDGRYLISLCGICRYEVIEEISVNTNYRQCKIQVLEEDLIEHSLEENPIDRDALLTAFRNFLNANSMDADWKAVTNTDNQTLVTALCMMCPYSPQEKQALLEAPDLKTRADTLIAISEVHLARNAGDDNIPLQ
ncbi:MAG: LON peptidase substrate-binding domain-containing protein [Pseudomonadota bacterium]